MYKGGRDTSSNDLSRIGESLNLTIYSQGVDNVDENAVIYFVMPKGITEATCCEKMSLGYHMCIDSGIRAKWLDEEECLLTVPVQRNVFVLSSFRSPIYDYLMSFYQNVRFEIIGPQCIRISVESKDDIPIRSKGHPMFTLAMQDIVVTMTGYSEKKAEKEELENLVKTMNGTVSPVFTVGTTHIVAGYLLTDKCKLAYSKEKPVMTPEWIRAAWKDSQKELIQATDPKYVKYVCPIFYNLNICVSQVPSVKKQALKSIIEANGGMYYNELARSSVNVLVIPSPGGEKYRFANDWKIPCVTPSWIENCKSVGHILPVENFSVIGDGNDIKSSTPSKTQKITFPSVESMIRYTSRVEVEATFCSTSNESLSTNVNTDALNVVKRASDEGPFLDGCKIYLCGSDTMEQVRKLLNGSGATRLNRLDENVTHILVVGSKIPDQDLNHLQKLTSKPHLVNMGWLVESAKQGSPADEEVYCFNTENPKPQDKYRKNLTGQLTPSLVELVERKSLRDKLSGVKNPSKPSHPLNVADKLVINAKQAIFPPLPISNAEHKEINAVEALREAAEDFSLLHANDNDNFAPLAGKDGTAEGHSSSKIPLSDKKSSGENGRVLSQHNKGVKKRVEESSVENVSQTMYDGEENDTNFTPFAGMKFAVHLVPEEKNTFEEIICEMQGDIVNDNYDIVILPVAYTKEQNLIGKTCYTKYWVLDCNEGKSMEIPEAVYHTPLPKFKGMGNVMEGVVIAVSQYGNSEKSYLATLAMEMGAEYQDVFSRKATDTTRRSTHLICSVSENNKCTAAYRWGVPVVTADWIYDCYRNRKMLSVSNYHPGNKKNDSDSTISCIPVTPKASNATSNANKLAQRLTAVSSIAFYPPSTSKPLRPPVPSVDVFTTPKAVKRKSSVNNTPASCGSISDIDVDSQTPVGKRHSKGNDSDLELVPTMPLEESPLLWGLSREASRQLKRGFDYACSNSPGPDITSLQVKFKKQPSNSALMNGILADLQEKFPRKKAIFQNQGSTSRLPVVKVSIENKVKESSRQNEISNASEFNGGRPNVDEELKTKRRKTNDSSPGDVSDRNAHIAMDIREIQAENDQFVSSHKKDGIRLKEVMKNVLAFISKRCENIDTLTEAIENMGGKVTPELKNSGLTHLVYQGKNAHMSKEVKTVSNSNVKVVDPVWILNCKEKNILLDENNYRPGRVSAEPVPPTVKDKSSSKHSIDALENLLQQHDVGVEEDVVLTYEDTQGRTIKYKKTENKEATDDDSDDAEGSYDSEWANNNNHHPKLTDKKENVENGPKTTVAERVTERIADENCSEEEKRKKGSNANGGTKENSYSKCKPEMDKINLAEKTDQPKATMTRVTRSRSVAQPIETRVNEEKVVAEKKSIEQVEPFGANPMFTISALSDELKLLAIKTINNLGGSVCTQSTFDFRTEATIAGTLARSEKVLGTLANGKRLLKASYINACLKFNRFVSPTDYMWSIEDAKNDLEKQVATAANFWFQRINLNPNDKPYAKLKIFLRSKKSAGLTRLISAGGGTVVSTEKEANLIIADAEFKEKFTGEIPVESATHLSQLLFAPSTEN